MQIVPPAKPKTAPSLALKMLNYFFGEALPAVALIGVRGYYANLFGVYDDAMIVVRNGRISTLNANCDPSVLIKSGHLSIFYENYADLI